MGWTTIIYLSLSYSGILDWSSTFSPLLISKKVRIDTATNIEEKVPINTPHIIAKAKSDKTAPPKKKIMNKAINVVTEVIIVLESVSFIDLL